MAAFSSSEPNPRWTGQNLASNLNKHKQRHVVLIGASIGQAWRISSLPMRIHNSTYSFEYVHGGSSFDKSDELRKVLRRTQNKPAAIFMKECAAYFPGSLDLYKSLMISWIEECQKENVVPIPATVLPVTRLHPYIAFIIDIVKGRNPLRLGLPFQNRRNKAILQYNDWIKKYGHEYGLTVLDLESSLIYNRENRYLREDCQSIDGLHLNKKAYQKLDQIVIPTLEKINWEINKDN